MSINDMIYIMNVDWNWIKQRPHFIAELMNKRFNVHALYQYRYGRSGLQQRKETEIDLRPIYVIPRGDRYSFLSKLNKKIKCYVIKKEIIKTDAGYVYLTFPDQVDAIFRDYKGSVIYDCMDNHPAFIKNEILKKKMISQERKLVNRADYIFASSEYLTKELINRYGNEIGKKIYLVRNGYNGEILDSQKLKRRETNGLYTFAYFGTISSWFNFDYILHSLDLMPDIQFEIFGPISGTEIPKHDRIHYYGTVEHDKLLNYVQHADCLIMPFVINDIIEAVDPVKLYEYINFNKDILTSYYKEIERFAPFVYFYNTFDEFVLQIKTLKNQKNNKYTDYERISFLEKIVGNAE